MRLLAMTSVVTSSLASEVATEGLLLRGVERGSEGASGRGARGAVTLARGGPPGLMGRPFCACLSATPLRPRLGDMETRCTASAIQKEAGRR